MNPAVVMQRAVGEARRGDGDGAHGAVLFLPAEVVRELFHGQVQRLRGQLRRGAARRFRFG